MHFIDTAFLVIISLCGGGSLEERMTGQNIPSEAISNTQINERFQTHNLCIHPNEIQTACKTLMYKRSQHGDVIIINALSGVPFKSKAIYPLRLIEQDGRKCVSMLDRSLNEMDMYFTENDELNIKDSDTYIPTKNTAPWELQKSYQSFKKELKEGFSETLGKSCFEYHLNDDAKTPDRIEILIHTYIEGEFQPNVIQAVFLPKSTKLKMIQ